MARGRSTSELLRTLSRVAASKPTSWLSGLPHILVTLSIRFGTLAGGLGCCPFDRGSSHPQSHSMAYNSGIRSLIELGRPCGPLAQSVLYPRNLLPQAAPQCISGRTSYHHTRLAFHSYPHLIQAFFNRPWFGPPAGVTRPSSWTWIDRMASGLQHATYALLRLGFPTAPYLPVLNLATHRNSTAHFAIGTPSRIAPLRLLVGTRFQVYFTPRQGCFSPFPLGTISLSVARRI